MFLPMIRACLALLAVAVPLFTASAADAPKADAPKTEATDPERARIETIVHDYLMAHPEVILQAVQTIQTKAQAEKAKAAQDAIVARAPDLLHSAHSPTLGNAKGDCVLVEFFDNQCPYCKANEPELQKLIKEDGRVKLVLKEFPILGPTSLTAAKAALAAVKQGKYAAFHEAILAHKGREDEDVVDQVAKDVGIDLDKLHKDMASSEITDEIDRNLELARALNITGTPGFVIGNQMVDGAVSLEELKKYVGDACQKKG